MSFVCWALYVCLVQTVWQSPSKLTLATMMILISRVLLALYSQDKVADQLSAVRSSFLMQIFIVGFVWPQRCLSQTFCFLQALTPCWWRATSTLSQDSMILMPVSCTRCQIHYCWRIPQQIHVKLSSSSFFSQPWSPCKILDKLCGGKKVSSWSNQLDCQTPA